MQILAGIIILALLWWFLKGYIKANPKVLAKYGKRIGGVVALAAAAFLFIRGRMDMAIPLGAAGAWLLGISLPVWPWYMPGGNPRGNEFGGTSRIRTSALDLQFDPSSGKILGRVLAGPYSGRDLEQMTREELFSLAEFLKNTDSDGLQALKSYFDGRFPGWRETADGNTYARASQRGQLGAMSEQEAYEVLGLQVGASAEDVRQAHRALMKKLHPDQGGSTYLATRVNMAKDVLLKTHG